MTVMYETIRRWREKFRAGFAHRVNVDSCKARATWHLDETYVMLRGESWLLWRAVNEYGFELEILVQHRRDKAAAKRFFKRVLQSNPVPRKIGRESCAAIRQPGGRCWNLPNLRHVFVKAAALLNSRPENSHQPTRECERRMKDSSRAISKE